MTSTSSISCGPFTAIEEAERILREALKQGEWGLSLREAATLGKIITDLVRWRHGHAGCAGCEALAVAELEKERKS